MTAATTPAEKTYPKGRRGFAAMDPEHVAHIAAMGGRTAHKLGTAHKWTSAEARVAGAKGGAAKRDKSLPRSA